MGLVEPGGRRPGQARAAAEALAAEIAVHSPACLRNDRRPPAGAGGHDEDEAMANELRHGRVPLESESGEGAGRFVRGQGRHGSFTE